MKKLIVALIACGAAYVSLAQVTQTSEAVDVFTPPHAFRDTIIPAHNKAVVDLAAVIAALNTETASMAFLTDTNANVSLTTKVPTGTDLTVLWTPNSTNEVVVSDSEAHTVTTLRRVSLNFGGTTNDWIEVVIDAQE